MNLGDVSSCDEVKNTVVINRLYSNVVYAFKMGKSIEDIAACYDYKPEYIEDIIREYCKR